MADEKTREADGGRGPARGGRLALACLCIGALLGGAGVVVALPPERVEVAADKRPPRIVDVQHPDLIEHQFNPRTEAGRAFANAAFYFVYRVREDRVGEAYEAIKANWDRARSNVLMLLRARRLADLNADAGQVALTKDLRDELDATFFPGHGGEKVAQVTEILWSKWIVQ